MKKLLGLLLALMVLLGTAAAQDDVFLVDLAQTAQGTTLASDRSYLCLTCPADGMDITVTITDGTGSLVYQRNYGACSGTFRSEDIYLRLNGNETTYSVSLQAGETSYGVYIQRTMPRLTATACAVGLSLQDMTGATGWKSATVLDVNALEGGSLTVPLHGNNAYEIGTATFTISGGRLTVSARLNNGVEGSIDASSVQVATTALEAQRLGREDFLGQTAPLEQPIDLQSSPYAAVLLNLTVSFDPSGVPASPTIELEGQRDLWQLMQQHTANEAVG